MAETTYTYSITNDTANGVATTQSLVTEVQASAIVTALDRIDTAGDDLNVVFKDALSAGDKTILDGLVSSHQGEPVPATTKQVTVGSQPPFAAKQLSNGKKLFSRVHGESYSVTAGSNILDYSIPYPQVKFNELEIIGAELGDIATLRIKDDSTGTYSTVPNYTLNTFGVDVNCAKDYYDRSSNYDADLYYGMRIYIEFESVSAKTVYINYILHELKD